MSIFGRRFPIHPTIINQVDYFSISTSTYGLLLPQNKLNAGSPVNWANPLNKGLVSWYLVSPLGHPGFRGGNRLLDLCGRNNGTLVNGPTWQGSTGRPGGWGSLSFNGSSSQYVDVPGVSINTGRDGYTFLCWFRVTNNSTLQGLGHSANTINGNGYQFFLNASGQLVAKKFGGGAAGEAISSTVIATNVWYFGAAVFVSINDRSVYLNGTLTGTNADIIGDQGTYPVQLGRAATGNYLTGAIDGFVLLDRALSAAEVWNLYDLSQRSYQGLLNTYRQKIVYSIAEVTQITFDATSTSNYFFSSDNYTWNHTCTGTNRYLIVGIAIFGMGISVSSLTYNGVSLTFIKASATPSSGDIRVEMWGLVNPASGTNTISLTLSSPVDSIGLASSFYNVNQTTPYEGAADNAGENAGSPDDATINITTVADEDMVVDLVGTNDASITVGAGQTAMQNVPGFSKSAAMSREGIISPAGSVTMNWTGVGTTNIWANVGIALRPTYTVVINSARSTMLLLGVGI